MGANKYPILFSSDQIQGMVKRLGDNITKDFRGKNLIIVGVLRGSFIFMADLCRQIDLQFQVDFVRLHSYGAQKESSGTVQISKDIETDIKDKDVLVIEEIVDTGRTLDFLIDRLKASDPSSLKVAALLDKPSRRVVPVKIDYLGAAVEDKFLVGYGLDFNEQYRNLPAIHFLE
ncbi:MAG: hypoxanthine phosphoribosyltransferase [Deltaproteobacteria bacterium RIFCSPHIGHO2_12_FULL_43_9]|nr:MAG: hypoxanthine phosphoribosyltransferase [Deltaproteobacteria bacterium RIFCSPHIGHO2_12_FULL_43_9]